MTHEGTYWPCGYMGDQWKCSCGWESRKYWDGAEYAHEEWKAHVKRVEANIWPDLEDMVKGREGR